MLFLSKRIKHSIKKIQTMLEFVTTWCLYYFIITKIAVTCWEKKSKGLFMETNCLTYDAC